MQQNSKNKQGPVTSDIVLPTMPIGSPEDLPDLGDQASDVALLPGEKIVNVQIFPDRTPSRLPSSLRELYRLAQASALGQIGALGPVVASLANEKLEQVLDSPQLHKFEALFGRDSLRVALDVLPRYPNLARATLVELAKLQGTETNLHREEEPGRIIHEFRQAHDPIAVELSRKNGWGWPYYGSVDATPEFVRTFAAYYRQMRDSEGSTFLNQTYTAKDGTEKKMSDALTSAVNWITGRLNANTEGLLEFKPVFHGSTENQAWKDSPDSYFHKNGELANHELGIASIEVQRVAYDALMDAAELFDSPLGLKQEAAELRARAKNLRKQIFEHFWTDEDGGYFVLGTDRDDTGKLRQLKIKTSNMGHLLHSRLLEGNDEEILRKREAVIRQLFSPALLNVSGIRTLASNEVRFRPRSYHNGSVWLWDTFLISQGLAHHGYHGLAYELTERIAGVITKTGMFPEYVRGDDSNALSMNNRIIDIWDPLLKRINRLEQPPQEVQAWSVAAVVRMKHERGLRMPVAASEPAKKELEDKILNSLPRAA